MNTLQMDLVTNEHTSGGWACLATLQMDLVPHLLILKKTLELGRS